MISRIITSNNPFLVFFIEKKCVFSFSKTNVVNIFFISIVFNKNINYICRALFLCLLCLFDGYLSFMSLEKAFALLKNAD